MKRLIATMVFVVLASSIDAVGQQAGMGPLNMDTPSLVMADAFSLSNPVEATADSVNRGKELFYTKQCVNCHEPRPLDERNGVSYFENISVRDRNEGVLFRAIRDGSGVDMPAFKGLIDQEMDIWHIVNYLKEWIAGSED